MMTDRRLLFRIIAFDSKQLFMRIRWALSLILVAILTFFEINQISTYTGKTGLGVGMWDVLFSVFGAPWTIIMVVTPLVAYLSSDVVSDRAYGSIHFLKATFRSQWWFCRTVILLTTIVGFTISVVMVTTLIASCFMPITTNWSQAALKSPTRFYMNPGTLSMSPYVAFFRLITLLVLGWLALGLLAMVVAYKANRAYGFISVVLIDLISFAVWKLEVGGYTAYALVTNHLLFSFHALGKNKSFTMPLSASFAFWLTFIALFLAISYRQSLNKDYY